MARPKTEFRNELKTRVPDHLYAGVDRYHKANRCASEARAVCELLELGVAFAAIQQFLRSNRCPADLASIFEILGVAVHGMAGSVPLHLADNSHEMAQSGPVIVCNK